MLWGILGEKSKQKQKYMPIEINGLKAEPWIGTLKGVKTIVKFKLLSEPLRAQIEGGGVIERPCTSFSFMARYTMRNMQGGYDVVQYFEHKTPNANQTNGISYKYSPEFMLIDNGEILVNTKANPDLYWFLNNCPDNASNPLYDIEERGADAKYAMEGRRTPFTFSEVEKANKKKKTAELDFDTQVAKCITLITDSNEISDKAAVTLYRAYGFGDAEELVDLEEYATIR